MRRYATLIISCLLLAGCSIFSPVSTPEVTQYDLKMTPNARFNHHEREKTVLVELPTIRQPYNTTDIVYMKRWNQPKVYAVSEWSTLPMYMVHELMLKTLNKTKYFKAVISPPTSGTPDMILNLQISQFYADFTKAKKEFTISAQSQLIDAKTFKVLAAKEYYVKTPIGQPSPNNVVLTANKGLKNLLYKLAEFTVLSTEANQTQES